jgi:hypothetical protein
VRPHLVRRAGLHDLRDARPFAPAPVEPMDEGLRRGAVHTERERERKKERERERERKKKEIRRGRNKHTCGNAQMVSHKEKK